MTDLPFWMFFFRFRKTCPTGSGACCLIPHLYYISDGYGREYCWEWKGVLGSDQYEVLWRPGGLPKLTAQLWNTTLDKTASSVEIRDPLGEWPHDCQTCVLFAWHLPTAGTVCLWLPSDENPSCILAVGEVQNTPLMATVAECTTYGCLWSLSWKNFSCPDRLGLWLTRAQRRFPITAIQLQKVVIG